MTLAMIRPHHRAIRSNTERRATKKAPYGRPFQDSSEVRLLLGSQTTETLVELVYAAAARNFFLLAGVERVASGTYVQAQIFTQGREGIDDVTARTLGGDGDVLRMDISFHGQPQLSGRVAIRSSVGHHTIVEHSFKGCE
jgi:hypothetical protein